MDFLVNRLRGGLDALQDYILAIIHTGGLMGADLALARIILSVSFASIIGIILSTTF